MQPIFAMALRSTLALGAAVVTAATLAGCSGGSAPVPQAAAAPAFVTGASASAASSGLGGPTVHIESVPPVRMFFDETPIDLSQVPEPPVDMVVADVDNANGPDIVVLTTHGTIAVLPNLGNGTFGEPKLSNAGCASLAVSLVVGQFNGDSTPDAVVACEDMIGDGFKRLLGHGDGTFANPETLAPVEPLHSALGEGQVHKLHLGAFGGGAGASAQSIVYAQDFFGARPFELLCYIRVAELVADFDAGGTFVPRCSVQFDVNGDITDTQAINIGGWIELAKAPLTTPDLSAFTFLPDGNLGALSASDAAPLTPGFNVEEYAPDVVPQAGPEVHASGDFDGDGVPEILALDGTRYVSVYRVEPSTALSAGFRSIAAPALVDTDPSQNAVNVAVGDFDGDGYRDLAVVLNNRTDGGGTMQVHPGNGDGTFGSVQPFPIDSTEPVQFIVADLDRDGRPDAVALGIHQPNPPTQTWPRVTVHLNRTPFASPNNPPTCAGGSTSVIVGGTLNGTLSCSDPDSGDTLSVSVVSAPSNGSLTLRADGTFTYTPTAGFHGSDSFTFEATDSHGAVSNAATESIVVAGLGAGDLGYAAVVMSSSAPPYPMPPVVLGVTGLLPPNILVPVELLGVSLVSVCSPGDPCTPGEPCTPTDPCAPFKLDAAIPPDPIRATPASIPPDPIRQAFDVLVTFAAHSSAGAVAPVLTPPSPIIPPDPIDQFDVTYKVFQPGAAVTTQTLHFAIATGQPYRFANVAAGLPQSPKFHVTFALAPTGAGAQAPGALWTVTPSGSIAPPDTTPPMLTTPSDLVRDATSPTGATVTYVASATDDLDPSPKVSCLPESGSIFRVGDTLVTCTATDAGGNSATKTFKVHVRGASEQIAQLIAKTRSYLGLPALSPSLFDQLQAAADALLAKRPGRACVLLELYSALVAHTPARLLSPSQKNELIGDATRIRQVIGC